MRTLVLLELLGMCKQVHAVCGNLSQVCERLSQRSPAFGAATLIALKMMWHTGVSANDELSHLDLFLQLGASSRQA